MERRDPVLQRVEPSLLTGRHEWLLDPIRDLSFRQYVEENTNPRADMGRYRLVAATDAQKARDCFSRLCASQRLFLVPHTLQCDRTFTRDVDEVYYLDAMDKFLNDPAEQVDVRDLPILQRPLDHRSFSAFSKRPYYMTEHYERRKYRLWLPHDSWENSQFSYADLAASFPRPRNWINQVSQPSCLPIPVPFAAFYYHRELTAKQHLQDTEVSQRVRRLRFCVMHEFLILYIAVWWNEAIHGCRQFVLKDTTIDVLDQQCGRIANIGGKPVQAVLEHMRAAARRESRSHNWMYLADQYMEYSTFTWAVEGTGEFDHSRNAGYTLHCDLKGRKIYGQAESRNAKDDVLEKVIAGPELHRIMGLAPIIAANRWDRHGALRVGDLLYHFVTFYNYATSKSYDPPGRALYSARKYGEYYERRQEQAYEHHRIQYANRDKEPRLEEQCDRERQDNSTYESFPLASYGSQEERGYGSKAVYHKRDPRDPRYNPYNDGKERGGVAVENVANRRNATSLGLFALRSAPVTGAVAPGTSQTIPIKNLPGPSLAVDHSITAAASAPTGYTSPVGAASLPATSAQTNRKRTSFPLRPFQSNVRKSCGNLSFSVREMANEDQTAQLGDERESKTARIDVESSFGRKAEAENSSTVAGAIVRTGNEPDLPGKSNADPQHSSY